MPIKFLFFGGSGPELRDKNVKRNVVLTKCSLVEHSWDSRYKDTENITALIKPQIKLTTNVLICEI